MKRMGTAGYSKMVATIAEHQGIRNGDDVFDAGMGCGAFGYFLLKTRPACRLIGIDAVENMVKVARLALGERHGPLCQAELTDYSFVPSSSVDHVVSVAAMEYLDSEETAEVKHSGSFRWPGGLIGPERAG